jgi:hypothetical protein
MTTRNTFILAGFVAPVLAGLAFLFLATAPAGSATGLAHPDLAMARLADFTLDRPPDGRVLLRFSATIVNVGNGPMELNATRASTSGAFDVVQRIYGTDGSTALPTPGVSLAFGGDGHNHWHINNLESYDLKRLDNGVKVGTAAKSGFCFFDTTAYRTSLPGAPASAFYRTTNACAYNNSSATSVTMGISVGWGDRYASTLPDQYIDITNLSPGKYRLEAKADPFNWFAETNESNNLTWVDLSVTTHRKHGTSVKIVSYGPSA